MIDVKLLENLNAKPVQSLHPGEIVELLHAEAADHAAWVLNAPEPEELWENLLFRGCVHLWAGPPKSLKSTFLTLLLYHLSGPERLELQVGKSVFTLLDGTFLGRKFKGRQRILMITENPAQFWKNRLLLPGVTVMSAYRVRALGLASVPALIGSGRYDLIVVDSLDKVLPIRDENDNAEIAGVVGPIVDAAHEAGVAVILIHHHRKSGGEGGDEIRGGSALFGAVDEYLAIKRLDGIRDDDDQDPAKPAYMALVPTGRLSVPKKLKLFCTLHDAWTPDDPGATQRKSEPDAKAKIVAALAEADGPLSRRALEEATGLSKASVNRHLRGLIAKKIVENVGTKRQPLFQLIENQ